MAKLSPPYIDKDCKSTGERMIFDMLKKDSFTEDWIVLHSLNLSQHTKRLYGEIDFLLLIPNAGVFVMEVKGGDVRCKNGEWEFIDRHGNVNRNKSPFNQARDAMFSLQAEVKKEFGAKHRFNKIQLGFLVAFPQVNFDKNSVEYEQWQIFDKTNYNSNHETFFKNLIQQFTEKHKTQLWFSPTESLPSRQDLEELCHFLRGDFMRVRSAKERLAEFDSQVKTYTEEQFGVLESIELNERSLVQGSAGTGKTMIAIESAIRAAAEGKKVFLTCYNRIIGEWMQKQLEGWSNITVSSLHSYLFELTKGFDYDKTQENKQDFYSKYLPNLMKEFFKIGVKGKFDKLIIDEGQDLIREEYLGLFDSMLTNGLANGNWEIYGDFERQAIFAQLSKSEMLDLLKTFGHHSKHLLRINCRNTKEIGEETSLISGFEKPPFLLEYLEGLPVAYHFYRDEAHQKQILNEQLKKVADEGLPLNEMVILSPKKLENSCVKSLPDYSIKEIKTANEVSATQKYFGFATVQSYKGMEGNYILITDIEDLSSEVAKSLLYVGMSRARYGLILLISEAIQRQYCEILQNKLR
ncbi:MAG: NERD and DEXDc domain [Prolixibacteraceae bacterium]|nr:MAG: NERD and DEXDc domain [Prolixibacteraceae bacterium]